MHVHFPEDHCPSPRASQFNEPEVFYTAKMQLLVCWSPDASVVPVSFSVYRLFLSLSGCVHTAFGTAKTSNMSANCWPSSGRPTVPHLFIPASFSSTHYT